jgi:hypothetical protein
MTYRAHAGSWTTDEATNDRKLEAVEGMRAALTALRDYLTRELEQP